MDDGENVRSLLLSNEPVYVNHFYRIFEELWKNGIEAKDRIRDIEEGVEPATIEIIPNPSYSIKRAFDLMNSAQEEVLRIFSSINAFHRQARLGIMHSFKDAIERDVRVRVLIPAHQNEILEIVTEVNLVLPQLEIGSVDKSLESTIGILVVDKKESLIIETKNDSVNNSYDAAGIASYSNSKPIALAYASIFDSLWKQTELHQKLGDMYERLRTQNKMQGEFINVAAHELRTPIVPILGLSEIMYSRMLKDSTHSIMNHDEKSNTKQHLEMLETVIRNANRLGRLAEDILDVTKIESESLYLKKEFFNLNDVITNCIDNITNIANNGQLGNSIKLEYQPCDILIDADKSRITQVISNILDNAVKFSKPNVNKASAVGIINIKIDKADDQTIVTITDAGTGIDPEIIPRLFDKFASKSFQGTGLGLYICKSIVQAHGGKIWAHNNDGTGATFAFTLPIANE